MEWGSVLTLSLTSYEFGHVIYLGLSLILQLCNGNKNLLSQRKGKETQLSTGLPLQSDLVSSRESGGSDVRLVTLVNLFFSQVFYLLIL